MNKLFIGMKNSKKNNIMVQMMDDVGKTSLANRDLPLTKGDESHSDLIVIILFSFSLRHQHSK
jgi:hypothetical protein